MLINFNGKELEVKYTFNSFKYMQEFDLGELATLDTKPFKILGVAETLLLGALNHDPKVIFNELEVSEYLENVIEEGNIAELLEDLMELLQESSFFKSLQKMDTKKKKKK